MEICLGEEGPAGQVGLGLEEMALAAGHVQGGASRAGQHAVGGAQAGDRVGLDDPSLGVEDIDQRTGAGLGPAGGGDDISLDVQAHTVDAALGVPFVGAEGVEGFVGAKGAIVVDGVGAQFPVDAGVVAVALGHVQGLAVDGHQDAVGHGAVGLDAGHGVAAVGLGGGAEHGAESRLFDLRCVDVGGVPGVGEPDASLAVHGQVVGGVQFVAVETVGDDHVISVGVEAQDGAAAGAATEELPIGVVGQAVGAVGSLAPDCDLVGLGVAAVDTAGGDVGKEQVFAVPDGSFGNAAVGFVEQLETPTHGRVPP